MKKNILFLPLLLLASTIISAQNLLDTSTWTIGSGGVSGFTQNGSTSENSREWGQNHIGENVILWKASPDIGNTHACGGWNSDYHNIDHTKTYRFSVWIKKTNSNSGHTYLGCASPNNILNLNENVNNNPYFWVGDLPKLNRWYLIVGFVHKSSYNSTVNEGRIYDGVTGEETLTITDYKFKNTATNVRHRSFLYYDTNPNDEQYFYDPRIELVDDSETPILELLRINPNSKLYFSYDNSGNQKQRFYCEVSNCPLPIPPAGKIENVEDLTSKEAKEITKVNEDIQLEKIILYPNPTKGVLTIKLNTNSAVLLSHSVNVYNNLGMLVHEVPSNSKNQIETDLSHLPTGTYFVHIHLSNGKNVTKKIIKD